MRALARCAVVVAAVIAIFAVPAIVSRLDPAPAPCGTPVPSPYGYPPQVRR
jgi:hypothetical protein